MKTKIFGGIAIVAIAIAVALNVSLNTSKTNNASLLALANVEALAGGEGPTYTLYCYYLWSNIAGMQYISCYSCHLLFYSLWKSYMNL
jgi:hypothetical protein